jgi:predicted NBD/HSP70 family sugar kinase
MALAPSRKATVRDLRRVNRAAVLKWLFQEGPLNRSVLARLTGLSAASITNVTAALLDEGLIVEAGRERSDGGRPRAVLQVNPAFGALLGIEVGETRIRIDAFDLAMSLVATAGVASHPQYQPPNETLRIVGLSVSELCEKLAAEGRRVLGVGVAVPGIVGHRGGQLQVHAPNIGWRNVALQPLAEHVGLPVFADNGAKALGQAEMWIGAGRGASHAAVALWGTGVGAAIFTDGALYRGATSSAGEWGHTTIVVGGKPCRCGASGCLEAYVGSGGLFEEWSQAEPGAACSADPDSESWLDRFVEAAKTNDRAVAALDRVATYLGTGIANLVNLFNPEKVVLGGWIGVKLGPVVIDRVRETVGRQALEYTSGGVSIEVGKLGAEAVAVGAALLVVDGLLLDGPTLPERPLPGLLRAGRTA